MVEIPMVFVGCLHSSSVYFVLLSNSLWPWLLVLLHFLSCLDRTNFFLQPRTTLMVFDIFFHTMLQMVSSSSLLDNYYCRRTRQMISSFSSLFHRWVHRLATCLPIFGLLVPFVHRFVDDRLSNSLVVFPKLYVSFSKIMLWIGFLYLRWFGSVLHVILECCRCIAILTCCPCNRSLLG